MMFKKVPHGKFSDKKPDSTVLSTCALGYNEVDFVKKMKNTGSVIGEKLIFKTHLQNMFLDFLAVFCAVGFEV
jgi:hypothetical protein